MTVGALLIGFLILVAVLAAIGFWQAKRDPKKKGEDEILPQSTVDNVFVWRDPLNRARYQDRDQPQDQDRE